MKKIILLFVISLMFVGCSTLKINTDYDEAFDFSRESSFVVVHQKVKGEDSLTIDRIKKSVEINLEQQSYKKVSKDEADLIFVFHMNVKDKTDVDTTYMGMGYGRYRYGGMMMTPVTTTYNYQEGTLVIDALNPKNQKIVWRATATTELKNKKTPQKRTEYINNIVSQMMSKFPK